MATIRKRGQFQWQVQVRRKGFPTATKTFDTRVDGEKWARSIESALDRGHLVSLVEAEKQTMGVLIDRYLKEQTPIKGSAKNEKQRLKALKVRFGETALVDMTASLIADFKNERLKKGLANQSVIHELNSLSVVIDKAMREWGIYLPANPWIAATARPRDEAEARNLWRQSAALGHTNAILQSRYVLSRRYRIGPEPRQRGGMDDARGHSRSAASTDLAAAEWLHRQIAAARRSGRWNDAGSAACGGTFQSLWRAGQLNRPGRGATRVSPNQLPSPCTTPTGTTSAPSARKPHNLSCAQDTIWVSHAA